MLLAAGKGSVAGPAASLSEADLAALSAARLAAWQEHNPQATNFQVCSGTYSCNQCLWLQWRLLLHLQSCQCWSISQSGSFCIILFWYVRHCHLMKQRQCEGAAAATV